METFDYSAITRSGVRKTGNLAAATARDARDMLRQRNLTPIELKLVKAKKNSGLVQSKVSHKDRTLAIRQLAILIDASTPVEEALKVTAMQFEKSRLREILLDIRTSVMAGQRFSESLQAYPAVFPPLHIAMVSSAEVSGNMAEVLERLAVDMEASQKLRRKVLAASIYPVVLTVVALTVVSILMVAVIPKVINQFQSFGQDLPPLTKGVIAVSGWMQAYGLPALIILCALIFGTMQALKRPEIKYQWDKMVLSLPMIGRLSRNLNAARFARTMAGLLSSGTPSLSAIGTAKHTLHNSVMRRAVDQAATKVREGAAVSLALRQTQVFPPLVTQMVAGGETGGDIALMFSKSADYLEDEFDTATTIFTNLLEPAIIIILALIVLLIIGAIFLPILQLNTMAF